MAQNLVVGLDGSPASDRALAFAKDLARAHDDTRLILVFVIEWSPFTFQSAEENDQRHKRREEEISQAQAKIVDPAASAARSEGFDVVDRVAHGDAAKILDQVAKKEGANQIIIGRVGQSGLVERIFGGVSGRLIATASVPVTIIP